MVRSLQSKASRRLIAVVDQRQGFVEIPDDILKIVLDPERLGLPAHPNYGWLCGDYCLYAALQNIPDAANIWLIEPDVRIHSEQPATFFDGKNETREADFITAWFVRASTEWCWHKTMSPFVQNSFNCMLQLCRFSRTAATHLLEERRVLWQRFQQDGLNLDDWPNDEAFVGATLMKHGYKISSFAQHAPAFKTAGIFTFIKPTSGRWIESTSPDNGIYHPVERGAKFLARAEAYLRASIRSEFTSGLAVSRNDGLEAQIAMERAASAGMPPVVAGLH
jgi:hypothetical protein